LIVVAVAGFCIIGIFAVLAIYGTRKYIANSKTAEARNALGQIAKDAQAAYERDKKLCGSAASTVPTSMSMVKGMKYQSSSSDWEVDKATSSGFACLRFSMDQPQYYMYSYASTPLSFQGIAHGDLNGDAVISTFEIDGSVSGGVLSVSPTIKETNPEE
jgi:type IV pilus assembly protein PilA